MCPRVFDIHWNNNFVTKNQHQYHLLAIADLGREPVAADTLQNASIYMYT